MMPTSSCWESGFSEFKLDFARTKKNLAMGDVVHSDDISAGGYIWKVFCYPRGINADSNGYYLSLLLRLVSKSTRNVKAIFECFLMGRHGEPSSWHSKRLLVYPPDGYSARHGWCFPQFVRRSDLKRDYLTTDGFVTFMLGVIVPQQREDNPVPVPTSDIAGHLGRLLDCADGSDDVTFTVDGETFQAHRAVLAARSPVFKAQLFGSMTDARMRCITLNDIKPETFQILLRFMYTDELPRDEEIQSSSNIDLFLDLLVAADMYQLDRLKLMCAHRLWECVSAETVAEVLACAEMYNCPELKSACLDLFVVEKNFKIAVLTDAYLQLIYVEFSVRH